MEDRQENPIMNHIMLRFRPIAPKPVMNGSGSDFSDLGKEVIAKKRTKRKYVRVNKNVKRKMKNKSDENFHSELADLRAVESWVTLECVTGGFGHGRRLGCTDMEKVSSLERDTCPGFVSVGDGVVKWVNLAYRKMVGPREEGRVVPQAVVWLMEKKKIPVGVEAFSCRVRVAYEGSGEKGKVVPCDVWRMDGELGEYAWRLDLEAALSLGR